MNRIQCSNDSRKRFACPLKNVVCDGVDREGFVGNLHIPYQICNLSIGDFVS